ncbi:MAG: hypothetical protein V4507_12790 [Verrucomicrobiota bacterium]
MIRLFLWFCTLVGFLVVWIVGAFFTQNLWLVPLISNRIEPFGVKFQAQEVRWLPEWPLRVRARQMVISYLDGQEPKDLLRGPELMIEMEGIPWSSGAWQIGRVEGNLDEICWAPRRVNLEVVEVADEEVNTTSSHKKISGVEKREPNRFSLLEYQFQLTRLVVYSSKPGIQPAVYLLNLKTPVVRGPFVGWSEIQKGIFPSSVQLNR